MVDITSMYLNIVILFWVWITFIFYTLSYRKFVSIEFMKILFWVVLALFFLVVNVTFVFLDKIFWLVDDNFSYIISGIITSLSALCFMISAVYMRKFSQVFGFADRKK